MSARVVTLLGVGKRGDKKRARQKAKRRSPEFEMTRVMELRAKTITLAGADMIIESDLEHPDAEAFESDRRSALASMMDRATAARSEIAALLAPFEAFEVLFAVWLSSRNRPGAPPPLLTMAPEMVASVLLDRSSPDPIASFVKETRNPLGPVPREAIALVADFVGALPLAFMAHVTGDDFRTTPWDDARMRFYQHRLVVRGWAYEEQELETLRQLFARFDDDLRRLAGYSVDELIALYKATGTVSMKRYQDFLKQGRQHHNHVEREADAERKKPSKSTSDFARYLASLPPKQAKAVLVNATGVWLSTHVGQVVPFDASELAAEAGVSQAAADAFLATFSCEFGRTKPPSLHVELEHIRETPILRGPDYRYLPFALDSLLFALRDHLTDVTKREQSIRDSYVRHRGGLLETRAVAALSKALDADWSHEGVHYYWRDEDGNQCEGEADAVIRADSILIIVEAKSHALHRSVRRIAPSMDQKLEEIFTEASDQLGQAEVVLIRGFPDRVTDSNGKDLQLDLDGITRVLQVGVTLEDLASLAPAAWRLRDAGLLPFSAEPPWFVSIHDLELICSLVESPAQLVHYMLRRRRTNRQQIWAMDEMDFFMRYLQKGLFWRDSDIDGAVVELTSHTDPLDAWWLGEHGRGPRAKRPSQRMNARTRELLNQIESTKMLTRIEAQMIILDLSDKAREQVSSGLRKVARKTLQDGKAHNLTVPVRDDFAVLVHSNPVGTEFEDAVAQLDRHAENRQRDSNLRRCLGLTTIVTADGQYPLSAVLILYDPDRVAEEESDEPSSSGRSAGVSDDEVQDLNV